MAFLFAFFAFLFGTAVGSFLNVLVMRRGTGLGLLRGSFCFSCGRGLLWYELVPLLSFLIQRGTCRRCGARISAQYPVVELLAGALFASIFLKLFSGAQLPFLIFEPRLFISFVLSFAYYAAAFSLLLAISAYDARHKIIPDGFIYTFIALSFVSIFTQSMADGFGIWNLFGNWKLEIGNFEILYHAGSGPVLALPFALLWLLSGGRWMGLGDAKLAWGIGWMLGLSAGAAALVASFWAGAAFGIAMIAKGRLAACSEQRRTALSSRRRTYTMKSEIPFGPFLAFGAFLAFLFDISFSDLQALFALV